MAAEGAMIELIEKHRGELEALCRRYRVKTLELFGSAADGTWDPAASDLDFLVEFLPLGPGELFDFFFDLRQDLQTLFRRKVDLITPRSIRSPRFRESVNQSRTVLYAA
jgi:predicted nucleotidyltransferase